MQDRSIIILKYESPSFAIQNVQLRYCSTFTKHPVYNNYSFCYYSLAPTSHIDLIETIVKGFHALHTIILYPSSSYDQDSVLFDYSHYFINDKNQLCCNLFGGLPNDLFQEGIPFPLCFGHSINVQTFNVFFPSLLMLFVHFTTSCASHYLLLLVLLCLSLSDISVILQGIFIYVAPKNNRSYLPFSDLCAFLALAYVSVGLMIVLENSGFAFSLIYSAI